MTRKNAYWVAPALTAAVLLSVYAAYGLFPFGSGTVSWCDMNQQVIPFLMDLKDILSGKANLFLNLQNAGGMSFWGVFLFFISSPFSFLVLLVGKAQIYSFINLLLLLKLMLCAVTACAFFKREFKNLTGLQLCAVSVMYAFCGYAMFYYQNIVWLDVMCLFPLLLIGLEKLMNEGKPLLYILIFTATLTVNFYLSYMVAVFLVLAVGFFLFFCVPKEERKSHALLFCLSTLAAGMMTCVVWLPLLLQYLSSARTGSLLSSLRSSKFLTRLDTTLPVLLCTGVAAAAVAMTFLLKRYRESHVRLTLCLFLLLLVPIFVEPINKMWHTGSYQSFPVRYGYIPAFLGLILLAGCISAINRKNEPLHTNQRRELSIFIAALSVAAVLFCAVLVICCDFGTVTAYTHTLSGNLDSFVHLLAFAAAASLAYLILLLLYYYGQIARKVFSVLLCVAAVGEAAFYSNVYIGSVKNNAAYYEPILDLGGRINDSSLYRVKMDEKYFDVNLIGGMGYPSLSHYTSLTSKDYLFAMKKLGYSSYWMEVNSNGGTKLTDALLGNKYTVKKTAALKTGETPVYSNGLYSIVQSENQLPVGILMKAADIGSLKSLPDVSRFQMQQYLFESVFSSSRQLFQQYEPTALENVAIRKTDHYDLAIQDPHFEGTVMYKIPVSGTQTLYFDCFDQLTNKLYEHISSAFSITVNGKILNLRYPTQPCNGIYRLGTFTNTTVEVEIGVLRGVYAKSFGVASMKDDVLASAVSAAKKASLRQSGNSIVGTASADAEGEYLFLPVSYGSGYSAQVNGNPTEISRVFDSFMAVPLKKGQNHIRISYLPTGFLPGAAVSLLGLGGLLLLLFAVRKGYLQRMARLQAVSEFLLRVLFFAVLAAVYIFPLFVFFT